MLNLLFGGISAPENKVCELDILSDEEYQKVIYEFNDTAVDYPKDKTVHQLFEEQVEKTPDRTAVIACDRTLTYRELNEQANRIAHGLIENGVKPGDIVALMLPRRSYLIAAMFGILKAGAAYMPIDISYSDERIQFMLDDSKTKALKLLIKISNALLAVGIDVRRRLFKSVLTSFGGRLQTIVSGGANIDNKYIDGFKAFGITIVNGYGITECGPVVATNRNKAVRCGTVGFPLKCNDVRIDRPNENGEGEILVKGSNVMLGYYKNPEATAESFDGEWFRTGDIGKFDSDGFLYVTGRLKNLIILANGKNVSPEEIEGNLSDIEEIKEVIVYAENDLITAEIYPDREAANVEEVIDAKILEINKALPTNKQIGRTKYRDTEFPKTTTKKIKRSVAVKIR